MKGCKQMTKITLYTDGACSGNPGTGGWAAILVAYDEAGKPLKEMELSGGEAETTNNRMEMLAVIEGLKSLTRASEVRIVSDSQYVINTMTKGWKRKANQDLWREMDAAVQPHTITWEYIKGHAGHEYNERADKLAVKASRQFGGKADDISASSAAVYIALKLTGKHGKWGTVIVTEQGETIRGDWLDNMTENRLALVAVLDAVQALPPKTEATIYIDNGYVRDGMSKWIHGWRKRKWRKADNQPIVHDDLWKRLDNVMRGHRLTLQALDGSVHSDQARLLAQD